MQTHTNCVFAACAIGLAISAKAIASVDTIGPNGIDSAGLTTANGLPLDGGAVGSVNPVAIGQVELSRSADYTFDTDPMLYNTDVNPAGVFRLRYTPVTFAATPNAMDEIGGANGQHALEVAGVMISTSTDTPPTPHTPTGVAPGAALYSIGIPNTSNSDQEAAVAMQHLATLAGVDIRAINYSALTPLPSGDTTDGNSLLTEFVDWSAHEHDVLYVCAGRKHPPLIRFLQTISTELRSLHRRKLVVLENTNTYRCSIHSHRMQRVIEHP